MICGDASSALACANAVDESTNPHFLCPREVVKTAIVAWEGNALKASFELGAQLSKQAISESEDESDDEMPILDDLVEAPALDGTDKPATATAAKPAVSGSAFAQMKAKVNRLQAMVTMLQSSRCACACACMHGFMLGIGWEALLLVPRLMRCPHQTWRQKLQEHLEARRVFVRSAGLTSVRG